VLDLPQKHGESVIYKVWSFIPVRDFFFVFDYTPMQMWAPFLRPLYPHPSKSKKRVSILDMLPETDADSSMRRCPSCQKKAEARDLRKVFLSFDTGAVRMHIVSFIFDPSITGFSCQL
jgi:hypothetical protein